MKTNENLTEKLEYIGLDLNNIPDKLNFFQNINFRVRKNYIEENYKVYKYVNVEDIQILNKNFNINSLVGSRYYKSFGQGYCCN